jgi:hypothetical protein
MIRVEWWCSPLAIPIHDGNDESSPDPHSPESTGTFSRGGPGNMLWRSSPTEIRPVRHIFMPE